MNSKPEFRQLPALVGLLDAPKALVRRIQILDRALLYLWLAAALVLAVSAIMFFWRMPLLLLLRDWCLDDTFYYLQPAKIFATQGSPSFDGENLTNGYHLLWWVCCVPVYWLGQSPENAVRLVKALEVVVAVGTLLTFTALFRTVRGFWFLGIPVLVGLVGSQAFYFGLEGGINTLTVAASGLVAIRVLSGPHPGMWAIVGVALVSSLAPMARIENIAFGLLFLTLLAGYGLWKIEWFTPRTAVALVLPYLGMVGAFLGTSRIVFGTAVPISALVKAWWASVDPAQAAGSATWYENFVALQSVPAVRIGFAYAGVGVGILIASWLVPRYRSSGNRRHQLLDVFFVSLALFHTVKTLIYAIFSTPYWSGVSWYHLSGFILKWFVVFYVVVRVAHVLCRIRFTDERKAAIAVWSSFGIASLIGVLLIAYHGAQLRDAVNEYRRWTTVRGADWEIASYMGAEWMNENLPATAKVGAWDAGVLGYFSEGTVVNLDGLSNSYDYLQSLKRGQFEEFLIEAEIEYIANLFPERLVDIRRFVQFESRQPHPLRGTLTLLYVDRRLRIRTDDGEVRSFRVYRYERP